MKILFLTDNFPPEVNAPATRTYDHARIWCQDGHDVTVITSAPNFPEGKVYSGYNNKLYQKEIVDGIEIIRVWTYMTANEGFIKRTLDFISFSVSSFIAGLFHKADVIVATSPQFFTALSGRTLSFWKRTPWIMEVRDLWPESIKAVGSMNNGLFFKYFSWQEKRCYRSAKKIVVVTDAFKEKIAQRGIDRNKIHVIKNGVDLTLFSPLAKDQQLEKSLSLEGKTVIGYIGTHGMAHKLDFILSCADRIKDDNSVCFLLIGSGAHKKELLKQKESLCLTNVIMLDPVPKHDVKRYISLIDIALINLRNSELFTTVIPSKIFENAAMNKPILLGVRGEAQEIIEKYNAGVCFMPEDEQDFLEKLNLLKTDRQKYNVCAQGCKQLAADFDRVKLAKDMLYVIDNL